MGNVLPLPCTCKEAMVVHATVAVKATRRKPVVANNVGGGSADQDGGKEKEKHVLICRVKHSPSVIPRRSPLQDIGNIALPRRQR